MIVVFQDISYNCLTGLPFSVGYLQRLSKLNASDNEIKELPPEIGDCFGNYKLSTYLFLQVLINNYEYLVIILHKLFFFKF